MTCQLISRYAGEIFRGAWRNIFPNGAFVSWRKFNRKFSLNRGFTVAELVVSVGIFSILTAVAVPQFVAVQPGMRLNGAARQVLGQLMWARAKAVEQNNNFVVSFPDNHSLTILDDKNNNNVADVGESIKTLDIQTDYYDTTVNKAGGPDPLFYARGTAGGTTTLTISNSSGTRTITVRSTGVVKID